MNATTGWQTIPTFAEQRAIERTMTKPAAAASRGAWLIALTAYPCSYAAETIAVMDRSHLFKDAKRAGMAFAPAFGHTNSRNYVLTRLSPQERADYNNLKLNRYTRPDALAAIGRADLVTT